MNATVLIFLAAYSLEERRQNREAHGQRIRQAACRFGLVLLRLIWRALP
jgi:hypothetical protein